MRVRELMSDTVITVPETATLKEAARVMTQKGISGLPVVDADEHLVGILSEADFVAHTSSHGRAGLLRTFLDDLRSRSFDDTVGDAMSRKLITIGPFESHNAAARLMQRHNVKRLPVVDSEGRVLGVISRSDVLAVFARPDEEIEGEVRDRLVGQVLSIDPEHVTVDVSDGHVTLSGTTPTKTEAHLLETMTNDLAGVISVKADLTFVVDDTHQTYESSPYGVPRRNW